MPIPDFGGGWWTDWLQASQGGPQSLPVRELFPLHSEASTESDAFRLLCSLLVFHGFCLGLLMLVSDNWQSFCGRLHQLTGQWWVNDAIILDDAFLINTLNPDQRYRRAETFFFNIGKNFTSLETNCYHKECSLLVHKSWSWGAVLAVNMCCAPSTLAALSPPPGSQSKAHMFPVSLSPTYIQKYKPFSFHLKSAPTLNAQV